jgi:hypothetical protein
MPSEVTPRLAHYGFVLQFAVALTLAGLGGATEKKVFPSETPRPTTRSAVQKSARVKPEGIDLNTTFIQRTPDYSQYKVQYTDEWVPYLEPGTESDQRWPLPGEIVTFTAHFMNKGTVDSGSSKWCQGRHF